MRNYYRIMLGRKSAHAEECYKGNFIGADFDIHQDLTGKLPENWREFNKEFIPVYLEKNPGKSKISAGLACGALWVVCKGIKRGDVVLCPDGQGSYHVGEVLDDYAYHAGQILPHRRTVRWYTERIERASMSEALQNSTGSIGTVSTITRYATEVEQLIGGKVPDTLISTDETVEDPATFALEKHLEAFLVENWKQTELGKKYDIFEEDGKLAQQFETEAGIIDILAISKDKKEFLVVELKKGRASDNVVGQVQRYMGFILEEYAEADQAVKGVIIALEEDPRMRWALKVVQNIEFYRYHISFQLFKV